MNIARFREVIKERIRIAEECQDEWTYGIEKCWKDEVEILTEDIPSTIIFLQNECTADEYSWISEVIEDIAEQTNNRELVECYKKLMSKFPEECIKFNISMSVEYAESALEEERDNGEEK